MPGYFPAGAGWPKVAKTTPGLIRGTVHKNLDRYLPSINETILAQLNLLNTENGGKSGIYPYVYISVSDDMVQHAASAHLTSHIRSWHAAGVTLSSVNDLPRMKNILMQ